MPALGAKLEIFLYLGVAIGTFLGVGWLRLVLVPLLVLGLGLFLNPGVGLIHTPATLVQAYVMMDYASSMYFTQMKAFNFKVGFNMLIGSNRSSRIL